MKQLHILDAKIADLFSRYDSRMDYETKPFVPTQKNSDSVLLEIESLEELIRKVDSGEENPSQGLLLYAFRERLNLMRARIQDDRSFPHRFVHQIIGKVNSLISLDARDERTRINILDDLLGHTLSTLEAVADLGPRVPGERKEMLIAVVDKFETLAATGSSRVRAVFTSVAEEHLDPLVVRLEAAADRARDVKARIESAPAPESHDMIAGISYEDTLRRIYDIEISELLSWYREEIDLCRERVRSLGNEIDPSRHPFAILEEDAGPYDSPEEMLAALKHYVAIARKASLEYTTLPEGEECEIWYVPEFLKDSYPWGGYYYGGSALNGDLLGAVFLNRYNYRAVSRGWVQLNAIHECYPGHHAQRVKTAASNMPRIFKVGTLQSTASPLNEGIAHRSETLMQDTMDDPLFPLFVAYRRLHTAVRIWVDLVLHHFHKGTEAAVEIYTTEMGFSREVAEGQVYSQLLMPGYFTVYYYGMRELSRMQEEYRWDDRDFTELSFSCGLISLSTFRQLLELKHEDRRRLLSGFHPST